MPRAGSPRAARPTPATVRLRLRLRPAGWISFRPHARTSPARGITGTTRSTTRVHRRLARTSCRVRFSAAASRRRCRCRARRSEDGTGPELAGPRLRRPRVAPAARGLLAPGKTGRVSLPDGRGEPSFRGHYGLALRVRADAGAAAHVDRPGAGALGRPVTAPGGRARGRGLLARRLRSG